MLPIFIAVLAMIAIFVLLVIFTQHRLVMLDENTGNAMSQIGLQLSNRFDALTALLEVTKGYAPYESEVLVETIKSGRSMITARSTPADVLQQESVFSKVWGRISVVTEQYPELMANSNYRKTMDAVEAFENMLRSSRLIYNDSVTKLNREIRMFPVSIIAGMLGFWQKEYLEEPKPNMK
ncbi:LemA family protein [Caproiciproducens sp. LBM24188]